MWDEPERFADVLVNTVLADTQPHMADGQAQPDTARQ
jgi:hypothetical protein